MREGVGSLRHAVCGDIGKAKIAPDLALALERGREVERGAIRLDGVNRPAEPHEAAAEVGEGEGWRRVGLVDRGGTIRHAGVADVTKALVGRAKRHVGLIGSLIGLIGDRGSERSDSILRTTGGKKGTTAVAREGAKAAVGAVREGGLVGVCRRLVLTELHIGVAP